MPNPVMNAQPHIRLYVLDLRVDAAQARDLQSVLSRSERQRAQSFVHERHRRRFIAAHAGLRQVLGRALAQPAAAVRLKAEPHHKPELADDCGVHFNLSHAQDIALVATTTHGPLGVDVEQVRRMEDMASVAEVVFCAAEREAWRSVPPAQVELAFFNGWTRKEALIKATGEGFRADLQALCVSLLPDEPPAVLAAPDHKNKPWQLMALEPWPGYVGAIAMRSEQPCVVQSTVESLGD